MTRYEYMIVQTGDYEGADRIDEWRKGLRIVKCTFHYYSNHLAEWGLEGWLLTGQYSVSNKREGIFAREIEEMEDKASAIEI